MTDHQPIGEMLISKGKITKEQLDTALRGKRAARRRIGEVLVDLGFVNEWDVAECLAEQFGFDVIDVNNVEAEPGALALLSSEVALAHRILPIRNSDDCIECIMADPIDFPTTDMIARLAGKRAVLHIAPASAIIALVKKVYQLDLKPVAASNRPLPKRSAPKPQKDRMAILAILDAALNTTKTAKGVNRN